MRILKICYKYQSELTISSLLVLVLLTLSSINVDAQTEENDDNSSNIFNDPESLNGTLVGEKRLNLTSLFDLVDQSVVQVSESSPTALGSRVGSGFVYDNQGHIITNYHVVAEAQVPEINLEDKEFQISFLDGTSYDARAIGADLDSELAILEVENITREKLVPLPLGDSSQLRVGESVVAIGNPFGLSGSMTEGIVSGLGRILPPSPSQDDLLLQQQNIPSFLIPNIIQTDAAINPGNSGGPLLNMDGEVIGVNTAIFSNTGLYAGVGFAIPSDIIKKVVPELISTGTYRHPYIGIVGVDVSPEIASVMRLNESRGFLVTEVTAESPAEKSGIRGGDVLTDVNGRQIELGGDVIIAVDNITVRKIDDLLSYLEAEQSVGENVILRVIRDGKIQEIGMVLAARPTQQQQEQIQQRQQEGPTLGINAINMTSEIAERMNLTQLRQQPLGKEGDAGGVLVVDVLSGGPAEKAGIRGGYIVANINGTQIELGGDVILSIDNTRIPNLDALQSVIENKNIGDTVQVTIIRDNQELSVPVKLGSTSELNMLQPNNGSFSSQPPTGSANDFFNDMYDFCVGTFGPNVCNPLFGR